MNNNKFNSSEKEMFYNLKLKKLYIDFMNGKEDEYEKFVENFYLKLVDFVENPDVLNPEELCKKIKEGPCIRSNENFIFFIFKDQEVQYITKFYFSVRPKLQEKFLVEYSDFVSKNDIKGFYKIRRSNSAEDLITVRVYDSKNVEEVFNFIKQFPTKKEKGLFMPTIDDIGVTVDCGGSFNTDLMYILMTFYENVENIEQVNIYNFLKFIKEKYKKLRYFGVRDMELTIYNLLNSLQDNFKLEDVIKFNERKNNGKRVKNNEKMLRVKLRKK